MTEHSLRRLVVTVLRPLDAISVENPAYPGTPDVNYRDGWIELKVAKVSGFIPGFTQHQRAWLYRRSRAGGLAYLLVAVPAWGIYDLCDGEFAFSLTHVPRAEPDTQRVRRFTSREELKTRLLECVTLVP